MVIYASVGACAALLALLIYRYDMYEREPWYMLALALAAGAVVSLGLGEVEDWVLGAFAAGGSPWARAAVAASHEEAGKLLIVLAVALIARRHFNDPMDGLIYGAFAGLGMAVEESVFYMAGADPELRGEFVRLLLHTLWGGLSGFGLGMAWFRIRWWPAKLAAGIAAAAGTHFAWDCIALNARGLAAHERPVFATIGLMLLALLLFGAAVSIANRCSREAFSPQCTGRLAGWPFTLLSRKRPR